MQFNSNKTARDKFVETEFNREYFKFPNEMEEAYSRVYAWLKLEVPGLEGSIKDRRFDLNYYVKHPENELKHWQGAGWEFSRLLPAHTLKAYKLFLQTQSEMESKLQSGSILDSSILNIIDNGCGGGSVTIGLISLLINYQKFRLANGYFISPIKIYCLGMDPNHVVLQIFTRFMDECVVSLRQHLIDCEVKTLLGTFPDLVGETISWFKEKSRWSSVILGLGNVIRPMTLDGEHRNNLIEKLKIQLNFPGNGHKDIYFRETNAIKTLMDNISIDTFITAIVGSDSRDNGIAKTWENEIDVLQTNLKKSLSHHFLSLDWKRRDYLIFLGPKENFYRLLDTVKNDLPFKTSFDGAVSIFYTEDFSLDIDWQKTISAENLLLAWSRVRNELSYLQAEDTLEIRLFEIDIEERIKKLRQEILSYRWTSLNINEMFNFGDYPFITSIDIRTLTKL